ncbi:hypothetical protein C672_0397 [[Clostridium] bifermentans ATCC 638]|uniref:Uncharacterized protein n=1 Tax=Paraclostridium bifermentans ATCC 638 = DSM 14991 TaxID=1233171 RepID=T4VTF1_PARBF|nr:hypothetical protein C672_0397 [[Clostridium] bifermentans ATCC 638] [Paraclostridium bifermentans ATCC 638 = DSM 14991]
MCLFIYQIPPLVSISTVINLYIFIYFFTKFTQAIHYIITYLTSCIN